jgi:hypothetical protein
MDDFTRSLQSRCTSSTRLTFQTSRTTLSSSCCDLLHFMRLFHSIILRPYFEDLNFTFSPTVSMLWSSNRPINFLIDLFSKFIYILSFHLLRTKATLLHYTRWMFYSLSTWGFRPSQMTDFFSKF